MSIRRMMLFTLGAKIKNLIQAFKERVLATQGEFEAETCLDAQLTQLDNQNLLDNASLIVTPNGYKETLLYAVKPNEVGTNLLLHSQDWTQSVWNKGGATIVSSTRTAPDGTATATELSDVNASTGVPTQTFIVATSTNIVFSIYTKNVSSTVPRRFLLRNATTATNFDILNFNYSSTGNLGNGWFSENVGNGWFRLSYTRTTGISVGDTLTIYYGRIGSAPVGATDVWQVWGAQIDTGSTLNEYIPTTSVRIINGTIGDMSVTRATTATRVNSDGLIEQVPYNLFSQSENFENASWTKQLTTIGQNAITAPNGTMTADNLIATSGVTYAYTGTLGVNVVSNSFLTFLDTRTVSIYLKYNGLNRIRFQYGQATPLSVNIYVEVDLQTGTITGTRYNNGGPELASNAFIEDVGNGWYRVGFNLIVPVSPTNNRLGVALGDTTKTIANGIDGVYVWGAQMVTGTQPKDYFPTTNRFNIPRIDYSNGSCPSILVEPQSTNQIRNNSMVGAVVGNPGTLPTNWFHSLIGMSREVVGLGIENGVNYIDIRISGTAGGAGTALQRIIFEQATQIAAANGQTWTLSNYVKLIAQPLPPTNYRFVMFELTSAGGFVTTGFQNITPTTTLQRFRFTRTLNGGATVARVQPIFEFNTVTGQAYDFTIRIGMPQMEQQSVATSIIPTTTAAVTRNADVISNTNVSTLIGQSEGTIFVEFVPKVVSSDIIRMTENINTFNNGFFIFINGQGNLQCSIRANGVNSVNHIIPVNISNTPIYKVAIKYSSGNTKIFVNGILRITNTTVYAFSLPLTRIQMDNAQWTGTNQTRAITNVSLWKTQITDAQAIQLTTL